MNAETRISVRYLTFEVAKRLDIKNCFNDKREKAVYVWLSLFLSHRTDVFLREF